MPRAQVEGEDAAILDLDILEDVRLQLERFVVGDQPGIAVHHHEAGVLGPADQHVQLAAGLAHALGAIHLDHARLVGRPCAGRRHAQKHAAEQPEAEHQGGGSAERTTRH